MYRSITTPSSYVTISAFSFDADGTVLSRIMWMLPKSGIEDALAKIYRSLTTDDVSSIRFEIIFNSRTGGVNAQAVEDVDDVRGAA